MLDVIIPAHNEAKNLPSLLKRLQGVMAKAKLSYRVIAVDDHSTDKTGSVLLRLSSRFPVTVVPNTDRQGKAFAILTGVKHAGSEIVAFIDADLQYPPEAIPDMIKSFTQQTGVVVANRRTYKSSWFRRFASRMDAFLFGRLMHGLTADVQSGLKLVRREVFDHLDRSLVGPWSIDIPLLVTAQDLGYQIDSVNISYEQRANGHSKIRFFQTAGDIAWGALKTKLLRRRTYQLLPEHAGSMLGAGVIHRRRRFITHSTLSHHHSALKTVKPWQQISAMVLLSTVVSGLILDATLTAIVVVAILSAIYFADVWFNLFLIVKSLRHEPVINVSDHELNELNNEDLPIYTILCPLYREARIVPQFLDGLRCLDWPKGKLDVQLLLEEDDTETIGAIRGMELPSYVRMTIVPHSQPKTKPKACNFGLNHAKGEYVVIYDAEDVPDPLQLKKAYVAFQKSPRNLFCLQAKLNYYNPHHNLLTRLFTAEYSLWFDVILPGLQSIETSIPLGGTSNHFRRKDLLSLHGWDPFNVTEDCDLGVRLFKSGNRTAIIDSTTLEEANSDVWNWVRQRSRWIKGYMQTYLVHMRNPFDFVKARGIHALIFQLVVGGKIAFMLINPILWVATISYFTLYAYVGPAIEALYPTPVFYMAVTSLVFGNFLYLYYYMIGCAKRGHWPVVKYVFLIPFYWLMVSVGAGMAFLQLLFKPHYWEKTHHGLHAAAQERKLLRERARADAQKAARARWQRFRELATTGVGSGGLLIAASMVANVFNFMTNAFLSRNLIIEDFGLINLFGNLLFLSQIAFGSLAATVTHRSAYLMGKYGSPAVTFWSTVRKKTVRVAIASSLLWMLLSPVLSLFFQSPSIGPFLMFTPVVLIGALSATDSGFLHGSLKFHAIALLTVVTTLTRLLLSVFFVFMEASALVYLAIPMSLMLSYAITRALVKKLAVSAASKTTVASTRFPRRFFLSSILLSVSDIGFLSVDVILAKHFLPPQQAGMFALLSLSGKMIYFAGSMFSRFLNPVISRVDGAGGDTHHVFHRLMAAVLLISVASYLAIGPFGSITVPILFGDAARLVSFFLPLYGLAILFFTVGSAIVAFHQARKHYLFVASGFIAALAQVVGIWTFHGDVQTIIIVVLTTSAGYLFSTIALHLWYARFVDLVNNASDFLGLFVTSEQPSGAPASKKRILVMNWRDKKHVWAGGAEVYIHELAKRWIKAGHPVTLFCGNDGKHPRNETIDGIRVIRRGGFFTVYVWAFLYYLFRLRTHTDLIVDCENGIPFFSPLYARKPVFLVIHHVHQEIFREHLVPPFSWLALFLEATLMPLVYRRAHVLTISESSKKAILRNRFTANTPVIVHNGVDLDHYKPGKKSVSPLILYVGRLKKYKNLRTFFQAVKLLSSMEIKFTVVVAGDGEDRPALEKLSHRLGIEQMVTFLGRVSEEKKIKLYQRAWVVVNPSTFEGWGITTIEANACGTPVVASDVPGLRDSVQNPHSGFLVDYQNPDDFADRIFRIITNQRLRQDLNRNARAWARQFSWDRSASQSLTVLTHDQ